ncbi:MAG: glycosyltransferase family 2 protein [Pyrinomonadaceae bacterium]
MTLDLAVVMPVYNEQECIAGVVEAWLTVLSELGIEYLIIVLNDGSQDETRKALSKFAEDRRVSVVNKTNSGHGPTVLLGYRQAVEMARWVFQCDSDDEMRPEHFPQLWEKRERYDALFGFRQGRQQNVGRRLISAFSRITVRLLFGNGVRDVNVPYRLMRADILRQIVVQIPDDTFAPNIIISGTMAGAGLRINNQLVPHEGRKTGTVSIMKWKLWRAAGKSLWQTIKCRPAIRRPDPPGVRDTYPV